MEVLEGLWQALLPGSPVRFGFTSGLFGLLFIGVLSLLAMGPAQPRWRVGVLLAFSLYFFARIGGLFVGLLVLSAFVDFRLGIALHSTPNQRLRNLYVALSLLVNLGLLAYFKYTGFFVELVNASGAQLAQPDILLPIISLSFYSFRSIGYILDLHGELIENPERRFDHYLLYVGSFFNVLAGPITAAERFLPQLYQPWQLTRQQAGRGLFLFATGMVKKVAIADYLGDNYVNRLFDAPLSYTGLENLLAGLAYMVQLFFDFGGYTDMAIGLALLCGLDIGINFREPFKAFSLTDFWRRWHISMSQWFNQYLFLPLSFAWRRLGRWGAALAAIVTFAASGFWHGAGFSFLVWGLMHGVGLGTEALTREIRGRLQSLWGPGVHRVLAVVLLWPFLWLTFLVFRAPNLSSAADMLEQIGGQFRGDLWLRWLEQYRYPAAVLLLGLVLIFLPGRWKVALETRFANLHWSLQGIALAVLALLAWQFRTAGSQPFVYLQF